jgi:hypothetical protein
MLGRNHHPDRSRWLGAVGAGALTLAAGLGAGAATARHYDAIVQLNGVPAGAYLEDTREDGGHLVDEVKQSLVLNRLGSRVSIDSDDTFDQDAQGRLLGGRFQESSAKDAVVIELRVKGRTLELTSRTGGKDYVRTIPFQGEALGPEGARRLLRQIRSGVPSGSYQTFVPSLGGLAKVTVTYQGRDSVQVEGRPAPAFKYSEVFAGLPGAMTLWTDAEGYTLRASQDSPFGPVAFVRGMPAMKGDQLWMVVALGPNSTALLDRALPGIQIADLQG